MYVGKQVRVFLKEQAIDAYEKLEKKSDKRSQTLLRALERKIAHLKRQPQHGDPIQKRVIPRGLNVHNLYRIELPQFWRVLYTIESDGKDIYVIILRIINHKEYDKLFGYRKQ